MVHDVLLSRVIDKVAVCYICALASGETVSCKVSFPAPSGRSRGTKISFRTNRSLYLSLRDSHHRARRIDEIRRIRLYVPRPRAQSLSRPPFCRTTR